MQQVVKMLNILKRTNVKKNAVTISVNWVSVLERPPYLRVKTEGFSRLPNTKQIKYDLFHGKVQSLLHKGANHFSQWREKQIHIQYKCKSTLWTYCSIELLKKWPKTTSHGLIGQH